jgi:hypothetical protein
MNNSQESWRLSPAELEAFERAIEREEPMSNKVKIPPYLRVIQGGKSARATEPVRRAVPKQLAFSF